MTWSWRAWKAEALEESWRLRREPRRGRPSGFDPAPILARFPADAKVTEIADELGVSTSTVHHWRGGRRRLSEELADQLAIRIDSHPLLIWGPDWEAA